MQLPTKEPKSPLTVCQYITAKRRYSKVALHALLPSLCQYPILKPAILSSSRQPSIYASLHKAIRVQLSPCRF